MTETAELRAWGRTMLALIDSDDYRRGVERLDRDAGWQRQVAAEQRVSDDYGVGSDDR